MALGDLLARALSDAGGQTSAARRSRFEQGLRQLLPVRDVRIRQAPVIPDEGSDSIYFRIPGASPGQPVLQAVFEPEHQPSGVEFRLLKAAASLAAVVLQFAPFGEDGVRQ
jgi:hypothetical protein